MTAESAKTSHGCCAPGRHDQVPGSADHEVGQRLPGPEGASKDAAGTAAALGDMVDIPGASFVMGTDEPYRYPGDGEGPTRKIKLSPYRIGRCSVTNDQFAAFVEDTGHRTEAEDFGWSFVFHLFLPDDFPDTRGVAATPWWRQVYGADWAHPAGPQSSLDRIGDHPVVHASWTDAEAYCAWAGGRLPTEAEWEHAARGGLVQKRFVWGDEYSPDGRTMCNIFEGTFPVENTVEDGYVGTAPACSFPPNGFGLFNMAGNVWEWCSDWFHTTYHADGPRLDPQGPPSGESKVMRGGSYLCHDSYCNRYRVSARSSNTADSSSGNLGFRIAADAIGT